MDEKKIKELNWELAQKKENEKKRTVKKIQGFKAKVGQWHSPRSIGVFNGKIFFQIATCYHRHCSSCLAREGQMNTMIEVKYEKRVLGNSLFFVIDCPSKISDEKENTISKYLGEIFGNKISIEPKGGECSFDVPLTTQDLDTLFIVKMKKNLSVLKEKILEIEILQGFEKHNKLLVAALTLDDFDITKVMKSLTTFAKDVPEKKVKRHYLSGIGGFVGRVIWSVLDEHMDTRTILFISNKYYWVNEMSDQTSRFFKVMAWEVANAWKKMDLCPGRFGDDKK